MNKPDLFKGQSSTEARRFLAQFLAWASEQPDLKNNHGKTIKSALGFLTDKAADWATPYLNEYNNGRVPFAGLWPNFVAAFKLCFKSVDPEMEARAAIETIHQGKGQSAAEYSQHFKDVGGRTGLSDADLLGRFQSSLLPEIRRNLVIVNIAQGRAPTLEEAIRRAISIDVFLRDPSMKDRSSQRPAAFTHTPADPYAMEIDANSTRPSNGNTREGFMAPMRGRCYGCGSQSHEKRNCTHKEATCHFCARKGHLESVCQDKFMGLERGRGKRQQPRRQQVSANTGAPFSLFPDEQVQIASSMPTPQAASPPVPPSTAHLAAQISQLQSLLDRANAMAPPSDFL
ncbi:hypothetical protein D9757_014519 [Collybiopsis confluens]|uniref:CCHC-type domain-containing protein n=1 Tax=Collybiopsis confluens TaxID=2823264 RepID=A0A8H5D0H6_9AGAR|nr:hypothetical protein D9757_014519 [Collybiopsis confluens]